MTDSNKSKKSISRATSAQKKELKPTKKPAGAKPPKKTAASKKQSSSPLKTMQTKGRLVRKSPTKKHGDKLSDDIVKSTNSEWFTHFSAYDINLLKAGKHYQLYHKLGSHPVEHNSIKGTYFAVWAPNARQIHVIGNFNGWNKSAHPMSARWDGSGIWETFIPEIGHGERYKYYILSQNGHEAEKGDPYARRWEQPPATASIVWNTSYQWGDEEWLSARKKTVMMEKPLSVYEVHLGSWQRVPEEGDRFLNYREIAAKLPAYCVEMGFTHVELLPVMEHPFYGSWGYQVTGYFAATTRFGTPEDFMFLIDSFHQKKIGVILDWVPSHFPTDAHGLDYFDGTHLYEHDDPRQGFHPDWKSNIFNYGRNEVRAFLISSAIFWLDLFHIDALRVDGVASMIYRDYSRNEGEWVPNKYGGRENLEAISLLQELNTAVHQFYPDTFTVAEESTAFPGVTHPSADGGLGFDLKWMMGWMHDALQYFSKDPIYRSHHQSNLTFSLYYTFSEKYVLPLSHDEVVHGKRSLINKMPGDEWQQFANLRLLYGYMYGHPGAKMLFMGGEFAQRHEWRHDFSLDWHESLNPSNQGIMKLVKDLNRLYQNEPALFELNYDPAGFEWIDFNDSSNCVLAWIRKGKNVQIIFIANFTPVVRENYRLGMPETGEYETLLNSDNRLYGGSGVGLEAVFTDDISFHGRACSVKLTLPSLGILMLKIKP